VEALLVSGAKDAAFGLAQRVPYEIGGRLFVSQTTVDHHVSAILGKLDVRSRGQAAGEAGRLGITGPR